ncbi:MAG TPA: electron transfer flavoprotein subunit alpha/FixB family protein [Syntrophales bacterium]|nr:electron transfer flavoprotein subunit alpha/FixB family protein [Syntrophales bacterium]HOU78398.1 electron transfer flavoprotein subunit alpha/FixB family protein [Syntrophales bacterium]HQG33418.1 electron transfer flavoprotein subunit alpha/FixB family protein [Syntrophales bacterium]HQI35711.1 electron transfer flavoprotein subunit alpha/FixB family protein [Syntrophales bacterium]
MKAGVVVIAEATPRGLTSASVKTVAFARRLAAATGESLLILVPGHFPVRGEDSGAGRNAPAGRPDMTAPVSGPETGNTRAEGNSTTAGVGETGGPGDVLLVSAAYLAEYGAESWKEALTPLCREIAPRFICIPHTSRGCDYGPGLAIRLEASLIGAVEGYRHYGGEIVFQRSVLKGQWRQEVRAERTPVVLTVYPEAGGQEGAINGDINGSEGKPATTAGTAAEKEPGGEAERGGGAESEGETVAVTAGENGGRKPTVKPAKREGGVAFPAGGRDGALPRELPDTPRLPRISFRTLPPAPTPRSRPLGKLPAAETAYDFSRAEVIVAAGQGIGAAENLVLIDRLAGIFPKGAVGCSRAVCDRGWMEYRRQIGMTGRTVAPPLYIACGISGAMPHLAGMRDSRWIIAINRDPHAAIFQIAHLGIVADLTAFIPVVLELAAQEEIS